ncbi:hypothetical protein ACVMDN_000676 [Bradyrhizobium sp. USDA 4510]
MRCARKWHHLTRVALPDTEPFELRGDARGTAKIRRALKVIAVPPCGANVRPSPSAVSAAQRKRTMWRPVRILRLRAANSAALFFSPPNRYWSECGEPIIERDEEPSPAEPMPASEPPLETETTVDGWRLQDLIASSRQSANASSRRATRTGDGEYARLTQPARSRIKRFTICSWSSIEMTSQNVTGKTAPTRSRRNSMTAR